MEPTRRRFLQLGAALGVLARGSGAQTPAGKPTPDPAAVPAKAPPFEISLAQWSLHKALQSGELKHLDFPAAAAKDYGIRCVEYVNSFFKEEARDPKYVAELARRCADLGVRSHLIMCDGEGALAASSTTERAVAVESHRRWLETAKALGCRSIRVNANGDGAREAQIGQAADGLVALAKHAEPLGLDVIVENHGGFTSDGAWLAAVMAKAAHPRVGTLPDFGNFDLGGGKLYDRYRGMEELMPYAKAVSAKSYDFDAAGNETTIDFERMLKIVLAAGFHSFVGIEYEGSRLSEKDGIVATRDLLLRLREKLA